MICFKYHIPSIDHALEYIYREDVGFKNKLMESLQK